MNIPPEPDTKDWTWVLRERCPQCRFDASEPPRSELAGLAGEVGRRWVDVLDAADDDFGVRPAPAVWSLLEYACHVRDVLDLATYRIGLMRETVGPTFANWDQDATAVEADYGSQDPRRVRDELDAAAGRFAAAVGSVPADAWQRTGLRGDGAAFTIESFVRYLLHDPIHHLTDVTGDGWG